MGTSWRGMLAPLDVSTGDGRRFLSSGVSSRELPLPLKWQRADTGGHDNSVIVGSLECIEYGTVREAIDAGWIDAASIEQSKFPDDMRAAWGSGRLFNDVNAREMPRLLEDVAEATHLLSKKVIGPSVDAGAYEVAVAIKGSNEALTEEQLEELFWDAGADEDIEFELLFTEYQIAAATLVSIPAFAECRPFQLFEYTAITAAVRKSGWENLSLAERDKEWDASAAEKRISDDAGIGGDSPDWEKYSQAFLYQDDEKDASTKGAYGFQIVDVVNGEYVIVPRAVFAVAGALEGARGGTKIPQEDQDAMKSVVEDLYARMAEEFDDETIVAPWVEDSASIVSAVTAASIAVSYDRKLFENPDLNQITPITVTDDGRVFGHIATHDTCHVGMPGVCTTAPVDDGEYEMFNRYQPDGIPIPVGRITSGGGNFRCTCPQCRGRNDDHACLKLSFGGTISHHDKLSTIAWVRAGEDTKLNAVWVSGIVNPAASKEDLAVLSRQKISGDWRPTSGKLSLIEVLALASEEPGYPLPRVRVAAGQLSALTAAGVIKPVDGYSGGVPVDGSIPVNTLADMIVERIIPQLTIAPTQMDVPDDDVESADEDNIKDVVSALFSEIDDSVTSSDILLIEEELRKVF